MTDISRFTELAALKRKLLASPKIAERVAAKVAPALSELAQQAFDAQQSPYGDKWGVGVDGKPIDLNESGAMRTKAIRYFPVGTKIRATVGSVRHARYQLKHGVLPRAGKLPSKWAEQVDRIAQRELAAEFGGGR